ncbi:MAG: alanine--tRNA ligase, partial [Oscillospiraceae bacterium]|nr:alanine--tRNA ligase [Oscillospiraceae bacterium]
MEWTGLSELRKQYLDFFVGKGHYLLESAPLVPEEDKSLLLINSGMAPLKKYFLGQARVPGDRAVSCQKCIRTPDIERVGKTARHGTYFEMLGNFSFADYFKREAISWAWELIVTVWKMPPEKLYMSVFQDDDEAYDIWTKEIGVPESRMVRLGREDNFWEIGAGPCGPCSEIYFDRGEQYGCEREDCAPGCDCDRFVEFWNLVFTQFISDGNGNYEKMAHGNIDTGMGLERIACIMQGVDNLFEVDTVRSIIKHIENLARVSYRTDEKTDVSLRVITDHLRSTVFMIGDGIMPSNEGRGYVLRRLLRRAARHGRLLGINEPFLFEAADTVIEENKSAYSYLSESRDYIKQTIKAEEERFLKTIDQGFGMLMEIVEDAVKKGETLIGGEPVFRLYDTFGFPLDMTREIIEERGLYVDVDVFDELMERQRLRAREERRSKEEIGWEDDMFASLDIEATEFAGYETLRTDSELLYMVVEGEEADTAAEGDRVTILLDKTPFYAEAGGQVSDVGFIRTEDSLVKIDACKLSMEGYYLHFGTVAEGTIKVRRTVEAEVDRARREATQRNHTSVHLLQQALREVLGDHVRQAGSYVDSERSRFDFSHFEAVSAEELRRAEHIVNQKILESLAVETSVLPIEEARGLGAIAIFGEKYGDKVRVVRVDGFSVEFCGGTHVSNTASIGSFKILSESSVAAGVRRIEATTGFGVMDYIYRQQDIMYEAARAFRLNSFSELGKRAQAVAETLKSYEKQIAALKSMDIRSSVSDALSSFTDVGGIKVRAARLTGLDHAALRRAA